jgi:hypothetical protein
VPLATAPAGQATAPRHNARVAQLLAHIQAHPMAGLAGIPMGYEREPYAEQLAQLLRGLRPEDVLPRGRAAPRTQHMGAVVAALLYLAGGGLDQAHNLVTPLCWGSHTAYGGAPIAGSPSAKDAAYVHALVHLREGKQVGEFGSGYSNANYWWGRGRGLALLAGRLAGWLAGRAGGRLDGGRAAPPAAQVRGGGEARDTRAAAGARAGAGRGRRRAGALRGQPREQLGALALRQPVPAGGGQRRAGGAALLRAGAGGRVAAALRQLPRAAVMPPRCRVAGRLG